MSKLVIVESIVFLFFILEFILILIVLSKAFNISAVTIEFMIKTRTSSVGSFKYA